MGGFNGGGDGGNTVEDPGGGGGGASDVRRGNELLVVAGGGGGGGGDDDFPEGGGGAGGGTEGAPGEDSGSDTASPGGGGGTQTAGGAGGATDASGETGSAGTGGTGGDGNDDSGGGGGGGRFGGGGGAGDVVDEGSSDDGGGGGGGPGFGPTGVAFETGSRPGNGLITVTYDASGRSCGAAPAAAPVAPVSGGPPVHRLSRPRARRRERGVDLAPSRAAVESTVLGGEGAGAWRSDAGRSGSVPAWRRSPWGRRVAVLLVPAISGKNTGQAPDAISSAGIRYQNTGASAPA